MSVRRPVPGRHWSTGAERRTRARGATRRVGAATLDGAAQDQVARHPGVRVGEGTECDDVGGPGPTPGRASRRARVGVAVGAGAQVEAAVGDHRGDGLDGPLPLAGQPDAGEVGLATSVSAVGKAVVQAATVGAGRQRLAERLDQPGR